jgi:hypothetical protein
MLPRLCVGTCVRIRVDAPGAALLSVVTVLAVLAAVQVLWLPMNGVLHRGWVWGVAGMKLVASTPTLRFGHSPNPTPRYLSALGGCFRNLISLPVYGAFSNG